MQRSALLPLWLLPIALLIGGVLAPGCGKKEPSPAEYGRRFRATMQKCCEGIKTLDKTPPPSRSLPLPQQRDILAGTMEKEAALCTTAAAELEANPPPSDAQTVHETVHRSIADIGRNLADLASAVRRDDPGSSGPLERRLDRRTRRFEADYDVQAKEFRAKTGVDLGPITLR